MSEFRILETSGGAFPVSETALRAARELFAAAEERDGTPPVSDQAMVGAARGDRLLLTFGEPGEAAGSEGARSDSRIPVAAGLIGAGELDLVVHPDARGRGLGTAALGELLARGEGDGEVRAWVHGENAAADALLERSGFQPTRVLLRMALSPEKLPEASGETRWPEGVRATVFDPASEVQAAEWVRVNAAAFASHPEQGRMTLDDFTELTREPWFDAADLILAFDEDHGVETAPLLGFAWVKTVRPDESDNAELPTDAGTGVDCELYVLGVHPDAAGRGLGRQLLGAALRRMAEHRPRRVSLYVDGDNTRAVELYERAGFTVDQRSSQWLRR